MEDYLVKIEENNSKINALAELVDGLSQQLQLWVQDRENQREGNHRNGQNIDHHHEHEDHRQRDRYGRREYRRPTQLTKMEFPKFTREDALGWLLKCKHYFKLNETPEASEIKITSMPLDPKAF